MKKSRLLLACFASFALTGCSIEDLMFWKKKDDSSSKKTYEYKIDLEGGTADEQEAILNAINKKAVCVHTKTASDIWPDGETILKEDDGAGIKLTTSQAVKLNGSTYTVKLTWDCDQTQPYFGSFLDGDATHKIIELNYKGYGVADGTFSWMLKGAECGGAKSKTGAKIDYSAVTRNQIYKYDDVKIDAAYAIHDTEKVVTAGSETYTYPSTFDIVDYEYHEGKKYSPYFISNNADNTNPDATKKYLYYNMVGKVIYLAPDGNFGLMADGKNVMELYQGSGEGIPLKAENFPNLAGEYVRVSGNMGQYCGNVQLSFITKIAGAQASEITAEPDLTYPALAEADLAALKVTGQGQKQAVLMSDGSCLSNSLRSVTGTLVAGSIKMKNGDDMETTAPADLVSGKRITFDLQVGSETITVAYDYHTDKTGSVGLFNAMKAKLTAGGSITVKGTMRYSGNDDNPFVLKNNPGVWNIVPFLANHVA